jgi:membrane protein implicated in regulation of membrane protease activity
MSGGTHDASFGTMGALGKKERARFWRDYALSNLPVVFACLVGWLLLDGVSLVLVVLSAMVVSELIFAVLSERHSHEDALVGADAMIGCTVTVRRAFEALVGTKGCHGRVLYAGEDWAARANSTDVDRLGPGARARIRAVEGLELVVEPEDGSAVTEEG